MNINNIYNKKLDKIIREYNDWLEKKDPEYYMLSIFVEAYKNNNFKDANDACEIIKEYNTEIKAELLELFDVKIDRLVIKEKFVQAAYYKNMRTYFFNRIL